MTENASLSITFVRDADTADVTDQRTLALDDDFNESVYGEAKSSFAPRDMAYLKFLSTSDSTYEILTSDGQARKIATDVPYDVVDDITFANVATGNLSYIPCNNWVGSTISYEWIGEDRGIPTFSGTNIYMAAAVVGILRVTYQTLGDRLTVTNDAANDVLVVVVQDATNTSMTVSFDQEEEDTTPQPYEIEVLDMCSGNAVPDANVYLNGSKIGETDANGLLNLGNLIPGDSYDLKITRTDYIDSDVDSLLNDSFTVPTS